MVSSPGFAQEDTAGHATGKAPKTDFQLAGVAKVRYCAAISGVSNSSNVSFSTQTSTT